MAFELAAHNKNGNASGMQDYMDAKERIHFQRSF